MEQAGAVELAEEGGDAAGAVDVLDVVGRGVGGDLAQAGYAARDRVDVVEREVDAGLVGDGEDVQDGVGEPPMATSRLMAFSKASLVAMERGRTESSSLS